MARGRDGVAGAMMGGVQASAGCGPGRVVDVRIHCERERGQAAVELIAGLPGLLLVAIVVMQLLAVGYTAVLAGDAAEAGALAMARGSAADAAARAATPGWARAGMRVQRMPGAVHVQMNPPRLVPWVGRLLRINASAAVAAPGRTGLVP